MNLKKTTTILFLVLTSMPTLACQPGGSYYGHHDRKLSKHELRAGPDRKQHHKQDIWEQLKAKKAQKAGNSISSQSAANYWVAYAQVLAAAVATQQECCQTRESNQNIERCTRPIATAILLTLLLIPRSADACDIQLSFFLNIGDDQGQPSQIAKDCCEMRDYWDISTKDIMIERTLALIKPDAVLAKHSGNIIDIIENNNFTILKMYKTHISKAKAEKFYAVHRNKPFFEALTSYVSSGPIIALALEKENAIKAWRDLMGNTNPANATPGTIRNLYGTSIRSNAVHGSDSPETAQKELAFFFIGNEETENYREGQKFLQKVSKKTTDPL